MKKGELAKEAARAEAWFLAASAWSAAALAPREAKQEEKLLERAFRADLKARALDPERAEREKSELAREHAEKRAKRVRA